MMPEVFTLFELQKTVEAILGPHLHKQNFRRLVESGGLVEPTGDYRFRTGGRPAQLYRFRRDVLMERSRPASDEGRTRLNRPGRASGRCQPTPIMHGALRLSPRLALRVRIAPI